MNLNSLIKQNRENKETKITPRLTFNKLGGPVVHMKVQKRYKDDLFMLEDEDGQIVMRIDYLGNLKLIESVMKKKDWTIGHDESNTCIKTHDDVSNGNISNSNISDDALNDNVSNDDVNDDNIKNNVSNDALNANNDENNDENIKNNNELNNDLNIENIENDELIDNKCDASNAGQNQIKSTKALNFDDGIVIGKWRIVPLDENLLIQKIINGEWTTKQLLN